MDTIRAITSNCPIRIPASAITNASNNAFLGSSVLPVPLAKILGAILSMAIACNIRGAPKMLPSADDKVAPQIPIITSAGTSDILKRI